MLRVVCFCLAMQCGQGHSCASNDLSACDTDEAPSSVMLLQTQTSLLSVPQPDFDSLDNLLTRPIAQQEGPSLESLEQPPPASQYQASLTGLDADVDATSANEMAVAESVSVQDVLGLVGTMGAQQRQHKQLASQLLKAQQHTKQLQDMVLGEKKRYASIDDKARKLAIQAELSMSAEQATVDHLKKEVSDLQKQLDGSHKNLEQKDGELSEAMQTSKQWQAKVETSSQREEMLLQARQVVERRAEAAEARERNALKAGELEDRALKQQEEYLRRLSQERNGGEMIEMPWESAPAGAELFSQSLQPQADYRLPPASKSPLQPSQTASFDQQSSHGFAHDHHTHQRHHSPQAYQLPQPVPVQFSSRHNWSPEGM